MWLAVWGKPEQVTAVLLVSEFLMVGEWHQIHAVLSVSASHTSQMVTADYKSILLLKEEEKQ